MKNIAVFASGSGSNAEQIIRYFKEHHLEARVALLLSNNPNAYALERAKNFQVDSLVFSREDLYNTSKIKNALTSNNIDLIVLAGFLWLMPNDIVAAFPDRIVNIHPALLPKYGGKGMYGDNVHRAVIAAGEKESGITIHYVNGEYDSGSAIFQTTCPVLPNDTPNALAQRIHRLEHEHFPKVIEQVIKTLPLQK